VTFKDLRRIIAEKKQGIRRKSKYYDPNYFWKGKKIISLDQWYQIKEGYGLKAALQYFPRHWAPCYCEISYLDLDVVSVKAAGNSTMTNPQAKVSLGLPTALMNSIWIFPIV
jgi:hypothetical protein